MWRQGGTDFAPGNGVVPNCRGQRRNFPQFLRYGLGMDPILQIPDRPKRRSALMLPLLLGLTVLLYTVLLMPVRHDGADGATASAAP